MPSIEGDPSACTCPAKVAMMLDGLHRGSQSIHRFAEALASGASAGTGRCQVEQIAEVTCRSWQRSRRPLVLTVPDADHDHGPSEEAIPRGCVVFCSSWLDICVQICWDCTGQFGGCTYTVVWY